jgi:DNA polymerase elongation subunit (family B)
MPSLSRDEWLWGWDPTPGIVSVWAEGDGRAVVWRRIPESGVLVREEERFRSWLLLDRLDDLLHLGPQLGRDGNEASLVSYRELEGTGELRYLVSAADAKILAAAVLEGASRRMGRRTGHLRDLGKDTFLALPPEEQYLVATGRTYFRGLSFDSLQRLQFDLETTGLDPMRDRIFMVAVRDQSGATELLEATSDGDAGEAELIHRLVAKVSAADPDVIENHNLHGFDLPFLDRRARILGVPLALGRIGPLGLRQRGARRGTTAGNDATRRIRFIAPGRELIDTLDAVLRYDFATRELPNHGLKAVARHLGLAGPNRENIRGDQIHAVYFTDPARVRRYAASDVEEVAGLARMLGGAAFALAQMAPRRYERVADAGAATGVIDPLLVRAYLRAGMALPAHQPGDGTPHSGAALHLFATGVARRVVKADVASLYPSLMREYRIGPSRDHLGAMLALVDRLVDLRLSAKANARAALPASAERYAHEAMSAAMKLVVNSAYGYLAAGGGLTRFADVHAANEVTRRGRETLALMCRELAARGVTLLEADTDGVYFAVPEGWEEADERRVVSEVAALLPRMAHLEFDGRYAAMLSHEPKNYALLGYDGSLHLRGVAFRSSRAEPFGEAFLRRAIVPLLEGDVEKVRDVYVAVLDALRRRELPAYDVSSRVRLTKTRPLYLATRETRKELPYEALLSSGRTSWSVGDRIRVYRTRTGSGGVIEESEDETVSSESADRRDYDVDHYARVLRETFAARLERAFTPADFEAVFADPDQLSLFAPPIATIRTVLNPLSEPGFTALGQT